MLFEAGLAMLPPPLAPLPDLRITELPPRFCCWRFSGCCSACCLIRQEQVHESRDQ